MIDVMRPVAATRAVQAPASINVADTQDTTVPRALLRFEIVYALAGVLRDLLSPLERDSCETTLAINFRFADGEAVSRFHHANCSRVMQSVPSASADGSGAQVRELRALVPSAHADGTDFTCVVRYWVICGDT